MQTVNTRSGLLDVRYIKDPIILRNKSFHAFLMNSVGLTAPLEKCYEMRKLDSISYHARGHVAATLASRSQLLTWQRVPQVPRGTTYVVTHGRYWHLSCRYEVMVACIRFGDLEVRVRGSEGLANGRLIRVLKCASTRSSKGLHMAEAEWSRKNITAALYASGRAFSDVLSTQIPNLLVDLATEENDNDIEGNKKFIKSSVDDLVLIPKESEVTPDSNLECDMPVNTPLPTIDVREENFNIKSSLREHVVDFLMENKDIDDLPRHLVKQLHSHLVNNLCSTKRMSDEPLGDDSKPRSYDVTFSNSLLNNNDDYTLCYDNPLFDDEFEDISSLDPLS
nr:hypothetical protein [Tanacetum cinerariifolium]